MQHLLGLCGCLLELFLLAAGILFTVLLRLPVLLLLLLARVLSGVVSCVCVHQHINT